MRISAVIGSGKLYTQETIQITTNEETIFFKAKIHFRHSSRLTKARGVFNGM